MEPAIVQAVSIAHPITISAGLACSPAKLAYMMAADTASMPHPIHLHCFFILSVAVGLDGPSPLRQACGFTDEGLGLEGQPVKPLAD